MVYNKCMECGCELKGYENFACINCRLNHEHTCIKRYIDQILRLKRPSAITRRKEWIQIAESEIKLLEHRKLQGDTHELL